MKNVMKEIMALAAGCILYAVSAALINPVDIVPGSVLGISVVAHSLWGVPVGMVNFICNVPIMIFCTMCFGKKILIYTIAIIVSTSALIDWWLPLFPALFAEHGLLLAVLGGAFMGIGAGLLMRAGGTMGGTTAIGRLLQKKNPGLNMGNALFIMDTMIILVGVFLLKSLTGLLYSIIYTFVCSEIIGMICSYKSNQGEALTNG